MHVLSREGGSAAFTARQQSDHAFVIVYRIRTDSDKAVRLLHRALLSMVKTEKVVEASLVWWYHWDAFFVSVTR